MLIPADLIDGERGADLYHAFVESSAARVKKECAFLNWLGLASSRLERHSPRRTFLPEANVRRLPNKAGNRIKKGAIYDWMLI
jgi:hypothetical protein